MVNLISKARLIFQSKSFNRNVLTVFLGTTTAQALTIIAGPIVTRIYSPGQYGIYTLFLSLVNLITPVVCAKYELAIVTADTDEDGFTLVFLGSIITLIICLLLFPFSIFFNNPLAQILNNVEFAPWLWTVPVAILISGIYNSLNGWNTRKKNFSRLSTNRITYSVTSDVSAIGLGLANLKTSGLISAWFLGQGLTTSLFAKDMVREDKKRFAQNWLEQLKKVARRYNNFPRFLVPSGIVESICMQMPPLIISAYFGSTILGLFSLALNMVSLPLNIIAGSVRDVFYQAASEDYRINGTCRPIFLSTLKKLAPIGILIFVVLVFTGNFLIAFVFGSKWEQSGVFTQIMAAMFFFRLISSPLGGVFFIAQKQKIAFIIQICLIVTMICTLPLIASQTHEPGLVIAAYSIIYSIKYIVELVLSYKFCINPNASGNL